MSKYAACEVDSSIDSIFPAGRSHQVKLLMLSYVNCIMEEQSRKFQGKFCKMQEKLTLFSPFENAYSNLAIFGIEHLQLLLACTFLLLIPLSAHLVALIRHCRKRTACAISLLLRNSPFLVVSELRTLCLSLASYIPECLVHEENAIQSVIGGVLFGPENAVYVLYVFSQAFILFQLKTSR